MMSRWVVGGVCLALVVVGLWTGVGAAKEPTAKSRDLAVTPKVAVGTVPITGEYWALLIGIDQYQQAPKLDTAVHDARGVREVLLARYGFQRDHVVELFDAQATGAKIESLPYTLGRQAGKDDSVFIYYAGHGQYDEDGKLGWWVPVDADPKEPGTFITNVSVRDYISSMKAKHVYLVADSCFSGTLFGTRALPPINDQWIARLAQKPSRWGLTSGSTEPVADKGKNGHSVFAYHFLALLQENTEPYLVPSQIHTKVAPLVANNADQTPRSEPIKGAGDEGGQFVFRLARAGSSTSSSAAIDRTDSLVAERQQLEEERRRLQVEREVAEWENLAAERQKLEEERKKTEIARAYPSFPPFEPTIKEYSGPQFPDSSLRW